MKDLHITSFCSKSVLGPVKPCPCLNHGGKIELFQVSLIGFQKFFLLFVDGMILEAWDVELERAYFLCFNFVSGQCWEETTILCNAIVVANHYFTYFKNCLISLYKHWCVTVYGM